MPDRRTQDFEKPDANADFDRSAPAQELSRSSPPTAVANDKAQQAVKKIFDAKSAFGINFSDNDRRDEPSVAELVISLADGKLQRLDNRANLANAIKQVYRDGGSAKEGELIQQINDKLDLYGTKFRLHLEPSPAGKGNLHNYRLSDGIQDQFISVDVNAPSEMTNSDYARVAAISLALGRGDEPLRDALARASQDNGAVGVSEMISLISDKLRLIVGRE